MDAKPRELYLLFRAYEGYEGSLLKVTSKNGKTASVSWLNLTWHWELLILTPSLLYSIARWVCHIQHESRRWSSKTRFTGEPRQTPTHPNSFLPFCFAIDKHRIVTWAHNYDNISFGLHTNSFSISPSHISCAQASHMCRNNKSDFSTFISTSRRCRAHHPMI